MKPTYSESTVCHRALSPGEYDEERSQHAKLTKIHLHASFRALRIVI